MKKLGLLFLAFLLFSCDCKKNEQYRYIVIQGENYYYSKVKPTQISDGCIKFTDQQSRQVEMCVTYIIRLRNK